MMDYVIVIGLSLASLVGGLALSINPVVGGFVIGGSTALAYILGKESND